MANNTHAVGQLQGYLLQARHMLFELISLDDITVSIESLDDVAVESIDGSVVAEQIKSVTSDNNPVSDRAIVFWKTMYNWFEYVREGSLTLDKTVFRMVVVSNQSIASGDIIELFHQACDEKQARTALQEAKTELWGAKEELKNSIPESYGKYLAVLFNYTNEQLVASIISKMSVEVHENDYDTKLFKRFCGIPALIPEFAESLCTYMCGWVNNKVNEQCKNGKAAFIKNKEFNEALQAQMRMYNQRNSLPALSSEIDSDTARTEVEQQDVYIQQLDLIETDFSDKLEAASDYLRTKAEIVVRADIGLVVQKSLDDYNNKITRLWRDKYRLAQLVQSDVDVVKGQKLYFGIRESASNCNLQGGDVPSFFGSGTLHTLANAPQDEPSIGWHPNYKELLKKDGGELE